MNGEERFDAVIIATPANVAGALLDGVDRGLARNLLDITYSSSVTVTLGYYMDQLANLPPGFGFLVPRSEGTRMLACTFVHNKFPHRAPEDKGILRCFLGGARDEAVLALSDDEILETVHRELRDIVKLDARPIFARVYRWRGAMAQYEPGHIARVRASRSGWRKFPAWHWPATPITASAYPTAFAPAWKPPSWLRNSHRSLSLPASLAAICRFVVECATV